MIDKRTASRRTSAKDRLLKAAAELFYRDGVGATGIDAVTARAGVAKMSLYNNFSSKAELVDAYIEARQDDWRGVLQDLLKGASHPKQKVLAVFDSYSVYAEREGFRGCGFFNAAAELPIGEPGRARVAAYKAEVEALFRQYLQELRPAAPSLVETAEHLSLLIEGAISRAGLEGKGERMKAARRIAETILDRFSPNGPNASTDV